jgi:hypothetical protein
MMFKSEHHALYVTSPPKKISMASSIYVFYCIGGYKENKKLITWLKETKSSNFQVNMGFTL